jgi:hypothetical protein
VANLVPALDAPRYLVARKLACHAPLQTIGLTRIEALTDERLQVVPQRLRQLGVGHTGYVGLLDDVPRVDVVVAIGL